MTGLWWLSLGMGTVISGGVAPLVRHPFKFLIPENYVGWVEVKYGVATAPELQMDHGTRLARISSNGTLVTSSTIEQGWAKDRYFYYSEDGSTV